MTPTSRPLWPLLALLVIALAFYVLTDSVWPLQFDELYHVLAAKSWADTGHPTILNGAYNRGWLYTAAAGLLYRLHLNLPALLTARLPAMACCAVLVVLVFDWTRRTASSRAAWLAAFMMILSDLAVQTAQFARFYSVQALFVWAGATLLYGGMRETGRRRILAIAIGSLCFLVALSLQITSVIAIAAVASFLLGDLVLQHRETLPGILRQWWIAILLILIAGCVALKLATPLLIKNYFYTAAWAAQYKYDWPYYARYFAHRAPTICLLIPITVWLSIAHKRKPALFCIWMFALPLLIHSFGGMKEHRYVFYAVPFLFAHIAMGLDLAATALARRMELRRPASSNGRQTHGIALLLVLAALVLANPMFAATARNVARNIRAAPRDPALLTRAPVDTPWTGQEDGLRRIVYGRSVVVAADDLRTTYYLGSYDFSLSRSRLTDIQEQREFGHDFRTGRRVVSKPSSLALIVRCYPKGAIIIPDERWQVDYSVPVDTARFIQTAATPAQPAIAGFHNFVWNHAANETDDCHKLRAGIAP